MNLHMIFGGMHLDGRKDATRRKPLAMLEAEPEQVIIPMSMHAGQPCTPTVCAGDTVALGQPIARNEEGMFIHASVSGTVQAVGPAPHPRGGQSPAVTIRSDGKQTLWPGCGQTQEDYTALTADEVAQRIRQGGVVGMGGFGYPTADKIAHSAGKVNTVIVNAAESEPYITADHRLLLERGEQVLIGLNLLVKAVGAKKGIVAVEGNKLNASEVLERTAKRCGLDGRICTVPSRYPLGAEKQVIKAVTGREVPPGGNAVDAGCVVFNAATAFAVYQAVVEKMPLTHRVITVTGGALPRPRNLWVPIGTPASLLIGAAGGLKETDALVLAGGPMMGQALEDLNAPVIKTTNALVCMLEGEYAKGQQETECIRCGRCVSACPMHLMPLLVDKELKLGGDVHELKRLHAEDCIGCGCCTYVCPSHIPLVTRMEQAKQKGGTSL